MHHTARRRGLSRLAGIRWAGPLRDDPADPTAGSADNGGAPADGSDTTDPDNNAPAEGGDGDGKADAKKPHIDGDVDRDRAERALAAARDAETKAKKRAQAAEAKATEAATAAEKAMNDLRDKLAVALGLKPDASQDPAELAKQAAAEREAAIKERDDAIAKIAKIQVETAVLRLAGKAGADGAELLDSAKFKAQLKDLEPVDDGFESALLDLMKQAVKDNPRRFGAEKPAPARQGTDITGSAGGPRKRPAGLGGAIARKYSG